VVVLLLCFGFVIPAWGMDEVLPAAGKAVHSEYRSPVPGASVRTVRWRFLEKAKNGARILLVRDQDKKLGTWAELQFDEHGKLSRMKIFRMVRGRLQVDEDYSGLEKQALVLPDSLMPLDWFNCSLRQDAEKAEKKLTLSRKIGKACFVTHLMVRCREISFPEACSQGMIADGNRELARSRQLYLREAFAELKDGLSPEPVLRQLWSEGSGFWLYEEKGNRRSWRSHD
jgi:hypothetical protein